LVEPEKPMEIRELMPYHRFLLKATVLQRSPLKTEGKAFFSADLVDHTGDQINAVFFGEAAAKYDSLLQEKKTYLFSQGTVKLQNHKYA
jgi:hypothetical protein